MAKQSKMDQKMKECFSTHSMIHSLSGLGIGLILVGLIPVLGQYALVLGIVALVFSVIWDYMR